MEKELLTVYTPTYNRSNLLGRVYDSLKKQTCHEFRWLVVDDGSTDDTEDTVLKWQKTEKNFQIDYYYKENGGIHTARDAAYHLCKTELILGVDSDDWLLSEAVETIINLWKKNRNLDVIGIFAPSIYEDGTRICPVFPEKLRYATCQEFLYKYRLNSDTVNVLKTSVMKSLLDAPSFPGEKLIGEGYKMIQIPDDKLFLIIDIPLQVKEYQKNGYTIEAYEGIFRNPRGFREDYKQHMIHAKYLKPRVRGVLGYIVCSFLIKDKRFIIDAPYPVIVAVFVPLGFISYLFLWIRRMKKNKVKIK